MCKRRTFAFGISLVTALSPPSVLAKERADVIWNEKTIVSRSDIRGSLTWKDYLLSLNKPKVVNCDFASRPTKCWRIGSRITANKSNLFYVNPYPALPMLWSNIPKGQESRFFSKPDVLRDFVYTASDTVASGFVPSDRLVRGHDALDLWQSLIDKPLPRDCECGIVLRSKFRGEEAISYCMVTNDSVGLGIPVDCQVVALKKSGKWLLLSSVGAEECGDCGASESNECTFETKASAATVAEKMVREMKRGITNLKMTVSNGKRGLIVRGGNDIVDSRWESGKFEKSEASYRISKSGGYIIIEGHYNVLVSVEPVKRDATWHDLSDLRFFKERIREIIKDRIALAFNRKVECDIL